MTLTLRSEDAVAAFLEHVADLVRRKLVTGLSIDMHAGRPSRVVIVFAIDPPADEVATLKKIESEGVKYTARGKKLVADAHPLTGKPCPILSIKVTKGPDQVMIEALSSRGQKLGGAIILRRYGRKPDDYVVVESINVDEELQRCGLGTRLYELAAAEACQADLPLRSDVFRSKCSEAFWKKQVAKGRARCLAPAKFEGSTFTSNQGGPCGQPVKGRGDCKQYELETCETSLTGLKRRRRRK